jgi:hypothetical protein
MLEVSCQFHDPDVLILMKDPQYPLKTGQLKLTYFRAQHKLEMSSQFNNPAEASSSEVGEMGLIVEY